MEINNITEKDLGGRVGQTFLAIYKKVANELTKEPEENINIWFKIDRDQYFPANLDIIPPLFGDTEPPFDYFCLSLEELKAKAFDEIFRHLPTQKQQSAASEIQAQLTAVGFRGIEFFYQYLDQPTKD